MNLSLLLRVAHSHSRWIPVRGDLAGILRPRLRRLKKRAGEAERGTGFGACRGQTDLISPLRRRDLFDFARTNACLEARLAASP